MPLLINEVHPNPNEGSEWIELVDKECLTIDCNFSSYKVFDSYHQIYEFDGEEVFNNQFLVIEVNGLNNDQDSVILKDESGNVIDSFTYTKTEKGQSWSKTEDNDFVLTQASPELENPTPTPALSPTSTPSPTPTTTQTPSPAPSSTQGNTSTTSKRIKKKYQYYQASKIKFESHDQIRGERLGKLVFLSKTKGQADILNAIIGSSLVALGSILLVYARYKNKNLKEIFSSLS